MLNVFGFFKSSVGITPAQISASFTSRVIANGGSLTITEQNAILTLVTNLVNNGLWSKMKLIYPFVGGTASSCAVNLVDTNYLATFSSGWTFASTGANGNGSNSFMKANGFNPSLLLPTNNTCFSFYSRTNNTFNGTDLGCQLTTSDLTRVSLSLNFSGSAYADLNDYTNGRIGVNPSGTSGFFIMSRESASLMKLYKNTAQIGATNTTTITSALPNAILSIGALDFNDGINYSSSNRQCAFSHVSTSLTSSEIVTFYNNIQTFQTTLSRQI